MCQERLDLEATQMFFFKIQLQSCTFQSFLLLLGKFLIFVCRGLRSTNTSSTAIIAAKETIIHSSSNPFRTIV